MNGRQVARSGKVKAGLAVLALPKDVFCWMGVTTLILLEARPTGPLTVFDTN